MFDHVGSTSWPRRNFAYLQRLAGLLATWPSDPLIAIVGPGAATHLMSRFLADAGDDTNAKRSGYLSDLARYADQLLRRIPALPLVSFEPLELDRLIARPHRIAVVDRSARVLAAVKRDLPLADIHHCDVVVSTPPITADAVVAFNVVSRTSDPGAATAHIVAAVKPGGLLMMDDRSASQWLASTNVAFDLIEGKLYRRRG